jgi:hypothetical protein
VFEDDGNKELVMLGNRTAVAAEVLSARSPAAEKTAAWRAKNGGRIAAWRAKSTNDPLHSHDGNTSRGRRIRDLYEAYLEAMGNPTDPLPQANAIAAAELKTAAEECRAAMLAGTGDSGQLEQLIRLENLAGRAERKLGIKHRSGTKPTLSEHLTRNRASGASR